MNRRERLDHELFHIFAAAANLVHQSIERGLVPNDVLSDAVCHLRVEADGESWGAAGVGVDDKVMTLRAKSASALAPGFLLGEAAVHNAIERKSLGYLYGFDGNDEDVKFFNENPVPDMEVMIAGLTALAVKSRIGHFWPTLTEKIARRARLSDGTMPLKSVIGDLAIFLNCYDKAKHQYQAKVAATGKRVRL